MELEQGDKMDTEEGEEKKPKSQAQSKASAIHIYLLSAGGTNSSN